MKPLLLALCLALTSCATTLYNPRTGGKLAHFGADAALIEYSGGGVTCRIVNHQPSRTIKAGGDAANKVAMTAAGVLMTRMIAP